MGAVTVKAAVATPLNSTPVVLVKLNPSMVTGVLVAPRAGEKPVTRGAPDKAPPLTPVGIESVLVTRIGPVVASAGTVATMRVSAVTLKSASAVSNLTSLAVEKPDPLITTCVPGLPNAGEKPPTT